MTDNEIIALQARQRTPLKASHQINVRSKCQCKDKDGKIGDFYFDPETGQQVNQTFDDYYTLVRWNIDNGRPFNELPNL